MNANLRYSAKFEPDTVGLATSFRDIPEALSQADSPEQAHELALDALAFYFDERRAIPLPSAVQRGEQMINCPLM